VIIINCLWEVKTLVETPILSVRDKRLRLVGTVWRANGTVSMPCGFKEIDEWGEGLIVGCRSVSNELVELRGPESNLVKMRGAWGESAYTVLPCTSCMRKRWGSPGLWDKGNMLKYFRNDVRELELGRTMPTDLLLVLIEANQQILH